ncbi:protein kinase [Deinococcus malanensis]|uniref:protein kinase domain-containing protein n=1 Tax=Deinococcus malanensis TaxID=1706855 RepID=UPI003645406D
MDVCEYCQHFPFNEQDILCPSCGAPRTLHLPSGTVLADGRFTIKNVIGQGGFGVTYQGTDALLARNIAIKELFPTGSLRTQNVLVTPSTAPAIFEQQKVGFINEFRVLARFSHPGIVRVHDVLEENGTAYAVMELLSGETLAQRIARQSRLPLPASTPSHVLSPRHWPSSIPSAFCTATSSQITFTLLPTSASF